MGLFGFGGKKDLFAAMRIIQECSKRVGDIEDCLEKEASIPLSNFSHGGAWLYGAVISAACWSAHFSTCSLMKDSVLKKTFSYYSEKFGAGYRTDLDECFQAVGAMLSAAPLQERNENNCILAALGWFEGSIEHVIGTYDETKVERIFVDKMSGISNVINHWIDSPGDPVAEQRRNDAASRAMGLPSLEDIKRKYR